MFPNEFRNSTYKEIKKYVESNGVKEKESIKEQIVILDALGSKVVLGHPLKKDKLIFLKDIFKELFDEENSQEQSQEEMIKILRSWKTEGDNNGSS